MNRAVASPPKLLESRAQHHPPQLHLDNFSQRLLAWFDRCGRHDLPWQHPRTAYRVWLSEVMLQQTQVGVVIPYFQRFVTALPNLPALAAASLDDVLALWSGLGYYSRARNLHRAAARCVEHLGGELPDTFDALISLPGIGRSTAGAILTQAHGLRYPILDGNVRRVLCRWQGIRGWAGTTSVQARLWALAESLLPQDTADAASRMADYTQAQMDLGATLCTRAGPACSICPLQSDCVAHREGMTAVLPESRPRKILPVRDAVVLLLRDQDDRILLSRRPPVGVWAQLWSLPEFASRDTAEQWLVHHFRIDLGVAAQLPIIEHGFSHYHLRLHPLVLPATRMRDAIGDTEDLRWQTTDTLHEVGLPAPIRKLLEATLQ